MGESETEKKHRLVRILGPRLAHLRELPIPQLKRLWGRETSQLRALEKQIFAARRELASAKREATAKKRAGILDRLENKLFAPLTCGVHLPDDSGKCPTWPGGLKEPFVTATVVTSGLKPEEVCDQLKRCDVAVRTRAGSVYTVLAPLRTLEALADVKGVVSVDLARPHFPNSSRSLGDALASSGIESLHADTSAPRLGAGVVVGIVDEALDLGHPDFQLQPAADKVSRVLYYWNQEELSPAGVGRTPDPLPVYARNPGAAYGVQYSKADIEDWLNGKVPVPFPPEKRTASHGTVVAGCAAGNGRAFQSYAAQPTARPDLTALLPLKGAAPEADIVFVARRGVAGSEILADSTAVQDAFAYVFARAEAEGKACVVNLSDSDNLGPHDGTSGGEKFLDGLLKTDAGADYPGRAITLSAGNSTGTGAHAEGSVQPGTPVELRLQYFPSGDDFPFDLPRRSDTVEIWYRGNESLELVIESPTSATSPKIVPTYTDTWVVGALNLRIHSEMRDPRNGDNMISVIFEVPEGGQIDVGIWKFTLQVTGSASVDIHAWVDRNNRGCCTWLVPEMNDTATTVATPATAAGPITVGAHDEQNPPAILPSSGLGLTRDGRTKPDLAAPGSAMYAPFPVKGVHDPAFPYLKAAGTSVAAPLVAGVCAILYGRGGSHPTLGVQYKDLTCNQIRSILLGQIGGNGLNPAAFGGGFLNATKIC